MSKYTPGPWVFEKSTPDSDFVLKGDLNDTHHLNVVLVAKDPFHKESPSLADQRLIAASPENLEDLKWALSIIELDAHCDATWERVAKIKARIDKIEGGE